MRAQATFEFLLILSAIGIVFLIMFIISSSANTNLAMSLDQASARRDATAYASAIDFVYLAGPGASFDFSPRNIDEDENITISANAVTAMKTEGSAGASLLIGDVNASAAPRGDIRITNVGGGIDITPR